MDLDLDGCEIKARGTSVEAYYPYLVESKGILVESKFKGIFIPPGAVDGL